MLILKMSVESNTAIDDRTQSLSSLRARAGKPLRDAVLQIYSQHSKSNDKSIQFLKSLKCFLPVEIGDRDFHFRANGYGRPTKTLLQPCLGVKDYVALSYPWRPSSGESNCSVRYEQTTEAAPVRDVVLDRTIRFIRYKQKSHDIIPFWIDKLSIEQNDSPEREQAMQSMDLVYKRCKFAVGYLWVEIQTQVNMYHLSRLLGDQIVEEKVNEEDITFRDCISTHTLNQLLDLLVQITDDQWWSRAWIYQEDYLAGTKMWLLIRHAQVLHKPEVENKLGNLPGEVTVRSDQFRKYATLFCLALFRKRGRSFARSTCNKILQRAGKYDLIHKYGLRRSYIERPMTINILKDLDKRNITVPSDLLAIAANVCDYDIRILPSKDDSLNMSLSLGVLTLCIANGELIMNDCGVKPLYENIFQFLEYHTKRINAPLHGGALTFIKHCRLPVSHLSMYGIHTKGFLWRLSDPIRPEQFQVSSSPKCESPSQRNIYRHGLDEYQRSRLRDLVKIFDQRDERRYKRLANDLADYLRNCGPYWRRDDWPPRYAMDLMAACIVNAMDTGKYLQVARLVRGSSGGGKSIPCRAIFVRDRNDMQRSGSKHIFTSWTPTYEHARDERRHKTMAKYVSIEVSIDESPHGLGRLRSKGWTNGLCFFDGETKYSFAFAWPESLCR